MPIAIGATTYVFRYLLDGSGSAPPLMELLGMARAAGLERLQICENARPLDLALPEWPSLRKKGDQLGLELSLGCMTLDRQVVDRYLDRVEAVCGSLLRIVLERDGERPLTVAQIRSFLDRLIRSLERRSIRLAIENHFDIPSRILAEAVCEYPPERVGFCVDIANSLRNFEDTETVVGLLGERAFCYHLKDYVVCGTNVGFSVTGAPLGEGQAHITWALKHIFERSESPEIYLETWTPSTGDRQTDIYADARWLERSIANLRARLPLIKQTKSRKS